MARPPTFSTDDTARAPFAPHGRVVITAEPRMLRAQITGPVNAELVLAFADAVNNVRANWQPQGAFVWYSTWHGSMMTQPAAMALYRTMLERSRNIRPQAVMHIVCVPYEVEGRRLMIPHWQRMYRETGFPLEIVDTPQEAEGRVAHYLAGNPPPP